MNILHVTAHLGGGVGKAHAALSAAMPPSIRRTYLLLEEARDRRYADEIADHGVEVRMARGLNDIAAQAAQADIVQVEFWNHPRLYECLASDLLPPMRSVFWSHVSGLFRPVIDSRLFETVHRFVFTTPASLALGRALPESVKARLSSIGSGFGFENRGETAPPDGAPICYLGTVDFVKMHPGLFDAIDGMRYDAIVAIWGAVDPEGDVAARARAMRRPERVMFMGQTDDPRAALSASRIFFYLLQPDHYGTAENALIEAMSLGLVPVVLANPAEQAIVTHGGDGLVAGSVADCAALLDGLLDDPARCAALGRVAAERAKSFSAERSADAFLRLWSEVLREDKRKPDFAAIIGATPLDWLRSTQGRAETSGKPTAERAAKGTLAHFRAAFPDHSCWTELDG
ncbi:glycosyltransferase [Rhizobium sp. FKL33]|uniref:glycosyltransferase n=1 Tax=Rhizobium sp. FKL33 TaxID=2562307 RepID=UPI0010C0A4A4|nr:glycosyltransferase [Rhizobium sp. FKL33]